MERTVPSTVSEEIDLYLRTIYSLLRSTAEVQIRTLEEIHAGTNSSLHLYARDSAPDTSAFIYSLLRLPDCIPQVKTVVLGQSSSVFAHQGYVNVEEWQEVSARARRRRCFFDGQHTLACYIASRSDIDDVVPTLTAFQIEWNKLHHLLQNADLRLIQQAHQGHPQAFATLANALEMPPEDLERLRVIWQAEFANQLETIASRPSALRLRLLSGSLSEYWRATRIWWDNIEQHFPRLSERPVYFISSNTHSITNLLSGYALQQEKNLIDFLKRTDDHSLLEEWNSILDQAVPSSQNNFLYYVLKKYQQTPEGQPLIAQQTQFEQSRGINRIPSVHAFDIETQVIEMRHLDPHTLDPRLSDNECSFLSHSDAIILNIDYPLGLSAYNILAQVAENAGPVLGIYIMGKAATLNGVRGDMMIPNVVHDEHSHNTYLFDNVFLASEVVPYLIYGTVLDNQKAMSVLGTFLQNSRVMDVIYREGYTDIEMEAGPYLSAVYEMHRPKRHPINEIANLYGVPFDVGILHYASDTPLSKGKNLGAGTLSYFGMDSTYAATVAILRRILRRECQRLGS